MWSVRLVRVAKAATVLPAAKVSVARVAKVRSVVRVAKDSVRSATAATVLSPI